MRGTKVMSTVLFALVGCNRAALPLAGDVPPTGVYDVTVMTNNDNCTPARAVGDLGNQGLVVDPDKMDMPIPSATNTWIRLQLATSNPDQYQSSDMTLPDGVGTVTHGLELVEATHSSITIHLTEDWTILEPPSRMIIPPPPARSCLSERTLIYTLVKTCPNMLKVGDGLGEQWQCQ